MEHSGGDHNGFCCGRCRDPWRVGDGPQCEAVARNPLPAANAVVPAAPVAAIPILGTDAPVAAAADPVVPAEPTGTRDGGPRGFQPLQRGLTDASLGDPGISRPLGPVWAHAAYHA